MIPRLLDYLPQRIDNKSFLFAVHMAREAADPLFRVGYNSLGAFATINHLHYQVYIYLFLLAYLLISDTRLYIFKCCYCSTWLQAYYLAVPLPVEKAPNRRVGEEKGLSDKGVVVSELWNYPTRGLVFEGGNTISDLSDVVASSCICLQNKNIPFNVLISDCGKRIFLFPQVLLFLTTTFADCVCS